MVIKEKEELKPEKAGDERILLALMPFWDPQIPPLGPAVLKSALQEHGYDAQTVDLNIELPFRTIYRKYFDHLIEMVPAERRRHLYNIGHEVLKNHLSAHQNHRAEAEYLHLVQDLVYKTFYTAVSVEQARELTEIIRQFYVNLESYLRELFLRVRPTVLGISVYTGSTAASLFAFKLARELDPTVRTIMGGGVFFSDLAVGSPNYTVFLEKAVHIDKIVIGEGERPLLDFVKGNLAEGEKAIISQEKPGYRMDLSSAPEPDFSGFDLRYYTHLATYTSRSCPFQCNFCVETTYWGKFRKKDPQRIAGEMSRLSHRYGNQLFVLCDCLLNPVISELSRRLVDREMSIYWDGYIRADRPTCDRENTLLWRKGGFYRARLGLESGSQRILDLMDKCITIEQIKSSVAAIASAGIKTATMWVIGYPGETEADFLNTLRLIEEMKDDIYEADCNPFWYYLTGQLNSETWDKNHKSRLLYPESAGDMLMQQTWIVDSEPSREETYRRVNRFIDFCRKLGIPNPYTLQETEAADERWHHLHKNAVPPMSAFRSQKNPIVENLAVEQLQTAEIIEDNGDWGF